MNKAEPEMRKEKKEELEPAAVCLHFSEESRDAFNRFTTEEELVATRPVRERENAEAATSCSTLFAW